jgi:uncharacterized membrane protein YkoI
MKHVITAAVAAGFLATAGIFATVTQRGAEPAVAATTAYAADSDVETNDDARETESKGAELNESRKLSRLAKISPADARRAAEARYRASATSVSLEDENGTVVYVVRIGSSDVKVDAGTGRVLYADSVDRGVSESGRVRGSVAGPDTDVEPPDR